MLRSIALALTLAAAPATAQSVIPCDGWQSSARNIVEPWSEYSRTFANGAIRLTLMDTVEPAAGAFYLMVLTPPYDELGGRTCGLVAEGEGSVGFAGIDFTSAKATYDPATGLTVGMPIQRFQPATGDFRASYLAVTINQATGTISVWTE